MGKDQVILAVRKKPVEWAANGAKVEGDVVISTFTPPLEQILQREQVSFERCHHLVNNSNLMEQSLPLELLCAPQH